MQDCFSCGGQEQAPQIMVHGAVLLGQQPLQSMLVLSSHETGLHQLILQFLQDCLS